RLPLRSKARAVGKFSPVRVVLAVVAPGANSLTVLPTALETKRLPLPSKASPKGLLSPVRVALGVGVPVPVGGDRRPAVNGASLIVKVRAPEVPPPAPGLTTVTLALPSSARSAAGTAAVSEVELPKAVVKAVPFQSTVELLVKLVPVTVRLKP